MGLFVGESTCTHTGQPTSNPDTTFTCSFANGLAWNQAHTLVVTIDTWPDKIVLNPMNPSAITLVIVLVGRLAFEYK